MKELSSSIPKDEQEDSKLSPIDHDSRTDKRVQPAPTPSTSTTRGPSDPREGLRPSLARRGGNPSGSGSYLLSPDNHIFIALCFIALFGTTPEHLQSLLDSNDIAVWHNFRENLVKRWGTLGITTGLILTSVMSMLFSDKVDGNSAAYIFAFATLCGTIISICFGTALTIVLKDVPVDELKVRILSYVMLSLTGL
jgi:hypothetical protein